MGILSKGPRDALEAEFEALGQTPRYRVLRGPEVGLAMVRGRICGVGAPFNLGDMTMTRCVVELAEGGAAGFSFVAGRDHRHAELSAVFDALLQREPDGPLKAMIERLAASQTARRMARQAATEPG